MPSENSGLAVNRNDLGQQFELRYESTATVKPQILMESHPIARGPFLSHVMEVLGLEHKAHHGLDVNWLAGWDPLCIR